MTAQAQSISPSGRAHAKRRLRNYLLDPGFQLKYTAMVVCVTVVVAGVLGYIAYQYSRGQTELMTINRIAAEMEKGGDADEEFIASLQRYAEQADRKVVIGIFAGICALAFALGITGIVITHRLVGPAYRLKRLFRQVARGSIRVDGNLRRRDELQDVFEAFREMVESLRTEQVQELEALEQALARAEGSGLPDDARSALEALRDRMRKALD